MATTRSGNAPARTGSRASSSASRSTQNSRRARRAQAPAAGAAAVQPAAGAAGGLADLDPAVRAQIQQAIMAAIAAYERQSGSQASREEPDQEPDQPADGERGVVEDEDRVRKDGEKIDTRNIKMSQYDGSVPEGSFDSKARDFVEELRDQIQDAQTLAGQTWSDAVKKAILKTYLTGMALKWFRDWQAVNPAASFADCCDALVHDHRPILLGVDVADRIRKERKRWNETYREYADRLMQMADALEGGKRQPANARHALVAFVRNAFPKYTDFFETKVNLECEQPEAELKAAVAILSRKAESDGRLPDKAKAKTAGQAQQVPKDKIKTSLRPQKPRPKASKKTDSAKNAQLKQTPPW